MKKTFCLLLFSFFTLVLFAEDPKKKDEDPKLSVKFDARFDGVLNTFRAEESKSPESGFIGKYLKLIVNGRINDKFSYSFRHRLYTTHKDPLNFFSATDWANVTYNINNKFSVTAGKQVVRVGTFEYDYAPIDVYFASHFWNNVNPFQIGISLGYYPNENHKLYAQFVNSPFSTKSLEGIYAYNLIWYGNVNDWFNTIYSLNLVEYQKGYFMNLIALGNKIKFGNGAIDIDYINRYAGNDTPFFADFTIVSNLLLNVNSNFNVFVKGGYDVNKSQKATASFFYDRYVKPGLEVGFYGAGAEYYPIKQNKSLRVHAFVYSTSEKSSPISFNIGLRWQMKVLDR